VDEKLSELIENLSDWDRGKRSGAHWGGGTDARPAPKRMSHPWAGVHFGKLDDAEAQAILQAEQALLCSPAANQPRLGPQHGSFVCLLYWGQTGIFGERYGHYYCCGPITEPLDRYGRMPLLEPQAWRGLEIMVAVPESGKLTDRSKRDTSQKCRIAANDFRGLYFAEPIAREALGITEFVTSFAPGWGR
jgi:hypothetical protein